jgi:hypothetical protein
MAAAFEKRTPILCYGPRAHVRPGERRFLLWPAWMFRVLAPRRHQHSLNILQRAVLGLCRAGIHRAEDVGARLEIARELAAHVLRGLIEQNAIGLDGVPTESGLSLLENDAIDAQEQVSGYVFQDPWTRELWPRLVSREEPQEVEYNEKGYPRLLWGTKGRPWRESAFLVFPSRDLAPAKPRPEHILQACTQHRRTRRNRRGVEMASDDIGSSPNSPTPLIERTSLIDDTPRPVFLVTYLYLPAQQEQGSQWSVCDPFGLGANPTLRAAIARQAQAAPELAAQLRQLHGDAVDKAGETLADSLSVIEQEAAFRVKEHLTLAVERSPIYDALLRMESAHGEVLTLGERCPLWKLENVLVEAQKCIERLLIALRERHPPNRCWEKLLEDREYNAMLFERIASRLSFRTPLPRSLARVQAGKVRWAAEHGGQSLRPHLLAALLTAHADASHPLHGAARQCPDLLHRLDALAEMRDTLAAHAHGRSLSGPQLSTAISTVYATIEALRGATLS